MVECPVTILGPLPSCAGENGFPSFALCQSSSCLLFAHLYGGFQLARTNSGETPCCFNAGCRFTCHPQPLSLVATKPHPPTPGSGPPRQGKHLFSQAPGLPRSVLSGCNTPAEKELLYHLLYLILLTRDASDLTWDLLHAKHIKADITYNLHSRL